MKRPFLICILLASSALLWAQDPPAKTITIRGLSAENAITGLFIKPETTYLPFELQAFSPGQYVDVGARRSVDFLKQVPNPDAPATPGWKKVGMVQLPGSSLTYTLFFIPLSHPDENGLEYKTIILDDESPAFKAGSLRLLNASPFPLAAMVGDTQLVLNPGGIKEITPKLNERQRVFMQIAANQNGTWKRFSKGSISLSQQRRATVIAAFSRTLMARLSSDTNAEQTDPAMSVATWHDPSVTPGK